MRYDETQPYHEEPPSWGLPPPLDWGGEGQPEPGGLFPREARPLFPPGEAGGAGPLVGEWESDWP